MRLLTLLTEFSVNWDIQVSIVLTCMPWPAHLYSAVSLVFLYNILAVFITVFQCISFYLGLSSLSWIHCMIYRTCIIYRSQCTYTCSSISRNCFHSWYPTNKEGLHSGHLWYQNSIKAVVCWKVSVKSTMFRTVSTDRQAEVVVCVYSIFFLGASVLNIWLLNSRVTLIFCDFAIKYGFVSTILRIEISRS